MESNLPESTFLYEIYFNKLSINKVIKDFGTSGLDSVKITKSITSKR